MDFLWCPSASWLAALFILSCFSAQHSCTNVLSGLPCAYLSGLIIIGKLTKVKIVKMRAAVIGKASTSCTKINTQSYKPTDHLFPIVFIMNITRFHNMLLHNFMHKTPVQAFYKVTVHVSCFIICMDYVYAL